MFLLRDGVLSSVLGVTESLRLRGDQLTPEQRDRSIEAIDRQVKRPFRLVDDLMGASRLDAGSLSAAPETVPARRFVAEVNGGSVSYAPMRPEVEWRGAEDDREVLRGAPFSVRMPQAQGRRGTARGWAGSRPG